MYVTVKLVRRKLIERSAVLLASAALFAVAAATPALGATWDFTRDSGLGGSGRTEGTMDFQSKLKMSWGGATWDICPGDDVGTSFVLEIDRTNVSNNLLTNAYALDTSGCSDGQSGGGAGSYEPPSDRKIVRARAILCFTNNGNPCWAVGGPPGVWKDNPHYP